jgi:hypothetical protein
MQGYWVARHCGIFLLFSGFFLLNHIQQGFYPKGCKWKQNIFRIHLYNIQSVEIVFNKKFFLKLYGFGNWGILSSIQVLVFLGSHYLRW